MKIIFLIQLALPVVLVISFAAWPVRSTLGFIAQLLAYLFVLACLATVGIWLFPPWWTPYVAMVALLALAPIARNRGCRPVVKQEWPIGLRGWSAFMLSVMAVLASSVFLTFAVQGHMPPKGVTMVSLYPPLQGSQLLVVNGGSVNVLNSHMQSLDNELARLRPWRGNAYALDIVAVDRVGFRAQSLQPADPSQYRVFGMLVHAPCAGTIVVAVDGLPDMQVPIHDRSNIAGNHVLIRCQEPLVDVLLAHLRKGTVRVHVEDTIVVGQVIGAVGNSGGTDEPHLHVHAQQEGPPAAPYSGDPVAMSFDGHYYVRGDRFGRSK